MWMMRGDMAHDNRGGANPGTDVAHFFNLSPKVGQRAPDYRGVSVAKISSGSPGWIRTSDHSINSRELLPGT
jgi:hypothetical protein